MDMTASTCTPHGAQSAAGILNCECFCITLDHRALCRAVEQEVDDPGFCATQLKERPHPLSSTPVFLFQI